MVTLCGSGVAKYHTDAHKLIKNLGKKKAKYHLQVATKASKQQQEQLLLSNFVEFLLKCECIINSNYKFTNNDNIRLLCCTI